MFPIPFNFPFRKKNGDMTTIGDAINSGGGGGGSYTPDYENEVLIIGEVDDWKYYIPMQKEYIGDGDIGYEIKTKSTSMDRAEIELYSIVVVDGEVLGKTLIKTLVHNGDNTYTDENINIIYTSASWKATLTTTMYDVTTNDEVQSPVTWGYNATKDYNWYMK